MKIYFLWSIDQQVNPSVNIDWLRLSNPFLNKPCEAFTLDGSASIQFNFMSSIECLISFFTEPTRRLPKHEINFCHHS